MTLDEAIRAFSDGFEIGDCDGTRAPNKESWITLTSGGLKADDEGTPGWFANEDLAARAWLWQACQYAEKKGGKKLYWRSRPVYEEREFIALNQAEMMNDARFLRDIAVRLGTVTCRMLVSKEKKE